VVTIARVAQVFELLRSAFLVNDKLASEKAVVAYVRGHENTLSAVWVLLDACAPQLTENNLLVLTQILNQVLTTVSGVAQPSPAALHALTNYKTMLYADQEVLWVGLTNSLSRYAILSPLYRFH
jgi:hypothetical protein